MKLIKVVGKWIIAVHDRNESPGNQLFVVILFILLLMKRRQSIWAARCLSHGNKTKVKRV